MSKPSSIDWGSIAGCAMVSMGVWCLWFGISRDNIETQRRSDIRDHLLQEKADCLAKGGTWVTLREGDIEGRCVVVKEQKP